MAVSRRVPSRIRHALVALAMVGIAACTGDRPTGPDTSILAAKGGGGIQVTGADPNNAPQDTRLDVRVSGSGFEPGFVVTLLLAGKSTPKVFTNSTRFEEGDLVADITIAVDAEIALYDIEVAPPRGRPGVGSELFSVGKGGGGDNPGSDIYQYTFTGDITTNPSTADATRTVGNHDRGQIRLHQREGNDPSDGIDDEGLILNGTFLDRFEGQTPTDQCFNGTLTLTSVEFITGTLRPDKKDMNKVEAVFHFTALDKDGNELTYRLGLDGTADTGGGGDEIFPPEPGETTTVTFTDASIGAQRKKEKNACSGSVTPIDISVRVKGIS